MNDWYRLAQMYSIEEQFHAPQHLERRHMSQNHTIPKKHPMLGNNKYHSWEKSIENPFTKIYRSRLPSGLEDTAPP